MSVARFPESGPGLGVIQRGFAVLVVLGRELDFGPGPGPGPGGGFIQSRLDMVVASKQLARLSQPRSDADLTS